MQLVSACLTATMRMELCKQAIVDLKAAPGWEVLADLWLAALAQRASVSVGLSALGEAAGCSGELSVRYCLPLHCSSRTLSPECIWGGFIEGPPHSAMRTEQHVHPVEPHAHCSRMRCSDAM